MGHIELKRFERGELPGSLESIFESIEAEGDEAVDDAADDGGLEITKWRQ